MYRPPGFKNPYNDTGADLEKIGRQIAFEAGADEYERCLITGGCCFTRKPIPIGDRLDWMPAGKAHQKGYLVFIEEE